jgi:hypothetical protein
LTGRQFDPLASSLGTRPNLLVLPWMKRSLFARRNILQPHDGIELLFRRKVIRIVPLAMDRVEADKTYRSLECLPIYHPTSNDKNGKDSDDVGDIVWEC